MIGSELSMTAANEMMRVNNTVVDDCQMGGRIIVPNPTSIKQLER